MPSVKVEKINPLDLELKDIVIGLDSMLYVLGNRVICNMGMEGDKKCLI